MIQTELFQLIIFLDRPTVNQEMQNRVNASERIAYPPPLPPHRRSYYENDSTFLQPENQSLLPKSYSTTSPYSIFPDDLQKSLYRPPNAHRQMMEFPNIVDEVSHSNIPTPKPRNRFSDLEEKVRKRRVEEDKNGWLCRDDLCDSSRTTLLTNPYLQRRVSRSPTTKCQPSRYTPRLTNAAKSRYTSAENLDGGQQIGLRHQQLHRSMTTLNLPPSGSQQVIFNSQNYDNSRLSGGADSWLTIADGRTRSRSGDMEANGESDIIRRPTMQTVDRRSSLVWRPMKFGQNVG